MATYGASIEDSDHTGPSCSFCRDIKFIHTSMYASSEGSSDFAHMVLGLQVAFIMIPFRISYILERNFTKLKENNYRFIHL